MKLAALLELAIAAEVDGEAYLVLGDGVEETPWLKERVEDGVRSVAEIILLRFALEALDDARVQKELAAAIARTGWQPPRHLTTARAKGKHLALALAAPVLFKAWPDHWPLAYRVMRRIPPIHVSFAMPEKRVVEKARAQ